MPFHLTYELEGAGWATAWIEDEGFKTVVRASYLGDLIVELAEAAIFIRDGAETADVVFLQEPGETRLVLKDTGDGLEYELRWHQTFKLFRTDPPGPYELIHRGQTAAWEFVSEVRKQLHRAFLQHGPEGYPEVWGDAELPMDLYNNLFNVME